jgi:hypothetical protein
MATLEQARIDIVTAIEAAKAGAPVSPLVIEYDNRIVVDTQTQTKPYLAVHVKFMEGRQADLSARPIHRISGQIHLAAVAKDGTGSSEALKLLDFFYPQLHQRSMGVVRCHMATLAQVKPHLGWNYYPVLIPFWFDKIY